MRSQFLRNAAGGLGKRGVGVGCHSVQRLKSLDFQTDCYFL
ncbi:hypothetical protein AVDCRST_MAG84-4385 [uncultured Microcoleus sp.]|uniref:Uncharacterized protein n=1 Tax=uncultured Microcoleus sp. TaxID=259945 RepID=A0A6J4MZH0_9CYAN|nr:hypothetical protein AVDCRST_MAG84-4385 [uncultured Microcoleus sp.]